MKEEERTYEIFTLQDENYETRSIQAPFGKQQISAPKSISGMSTRIQPRESNIEGRKEKNE